MNTLFIVAALVLLWYFWPQIKAHVACSCGPEKMTPGQEVKQAVVQFSSNLQRRLGMQSASEGYIDIPVGHAGGLRGEHYTDKHEPGFGTNWAGVYRTSVLPEPNYG